MLEWLSRWKDVGLVLALCYAIYVSQRAKVHTYWNAEDLRKLLHIVQQEHPEYFQPEPEEFQPEELEVEVEDVSSEEVPA